MKTNYIIFSYVIGITFLIITTLIGCKKEYKFDDGIPAATFAPSIADTAFFGEKLTINFIAKNLSSGTLTLAPINNQDSIVFQEDIKNENSSYIFDTEVLIPEDGSWHGNY
ncbi:hypothetical protein [Sphingobacterium tabacisoli]|nr:hypothetical protein [Sphingobacterium tabacisoli]